MEHLGYLFAAYSVIFVAIFLYVVFMWRRQSLLQRELDALRKRLDALNDLKPDEEVRPDRSS
jgi:CcmD family protein